MILHPLQQKAVDRCRDSRLFVLVGEGGTGKTAVLKNIVRQLIRGGERVFVTSFTGKAVAVAKESLGEEVASSPSVSFDTISMTLHHYDKVKRRRGNALIVDEASQVCTAEAGELFRAIKPSRIILVGDPYQLPPIGGTSLLMEVLATKEDTKLNWVELTHVYRQEKNELLENLTMFREKIGLSIKDLKQGPSFRVVVADVMDPQILKETVRRIAGELGEEYDEEVPTTLCLTHETRHLVNSAIQSLVNLSNRVFPLASEPDYWLGDPVVCMENVYGVDRKILVTRGMRGMVTTKGVRYENGFEDVRPYRSTFTLAYALTVSSSQGSQFDETVLVVFDAKKFPRSAPFRPLLYTAASRAKRRVVFMVDGDLSLMMATAKPWGADRVESTFAEMVREFAKRPWEFLWIVAMIGWLPPRKSRKRRVVEVEETVPEKSERKVAKDDDAGNSGEDEL